jgi:hypothetical protein
MNAGLLGFSVNILGFSCRSKIDLDLDLKTQPEVVKLNDNPDTHKEASISSNKKCPHIEEEKRDSKKTKKEAAKNRAFKGFNTKVDERDKPPHEGSFANPSLREQFGIELLTTMMNDEEKDTTTNTAILLLIMGILSFGNVNPYCKQIGPAEPPI